MIPMPPGNRTRVALVGTYPPTPCGLATYTANVARALDRSGLAVGVIRSLGPDEDALPVPTGVVATWRRGSERGFRSALRAANEADVVLLQHEFGIYPGPDGIDIVDFAAACEPPLVTVLHTVSNEPSAAQRSIVEALAARSANVVVHGAAARDRLLAGHRLDAERVVIIPHGATPNLHAPPYTFVPTPVVLTWGLLGPGKGIEHGIEAIALLRKSGIEVRYVVSGRTHPNVLAVEGESYRRQLEHLAAQLGVADLVEFDERYLDWPDQHALVRSASIVLLPYDTRVQVTSGVLVEALAAGKPVVASAFPHAIELEPTGAVRVVAHGSPPAIAAAISQIVTHPEVRRSMEAAARIQGARHDWSIVGERYAAVLHSALWCRGSGCGRRAPATGDAAAGGSMFDIHEPVRRLR